MKYLILLSLLVGCSRDNNKVYSIEEAFECAKAAAADNEICCFTVAKSQNPYLDGQYCMQYKNKQ